MARHSTALRLSHEEESKIARAAHLRGQDTRTFIREAATQLAQSMLDEELYRQHLLAKLNEVSATRKTTKSQGHDEVMRMMRKKWR